MHRPRWSPMTYHPPKPKNPRAPTHSLWSEPHPYPFLPAQTSGVRLDKNNESLNLRPSCLITANMALTAPSDTPQGASCTPGLGALWAKATEAPPRPAHLPSLLAFHTEEEFAEILCRAGASLYIPSLSPANKTQRGNGTPVHHRTN